MIKYLSNLSVFVFLVQRRTWHRKELSDVGACCTGARVRGGLAARAALLESSRLNWKSMVQSIQPLV
ncbi:hypothetical protein EPI10_029214 [Gossypium australe]|uniref:Uncharacterized protein n=1 Tax=Gossypium australe TaxID=47621 RepID=A0A5B6V0T9_9ROSI|nr:hypothetical protein EPI10_029214 [Gossypium australe]